MFFSVMIVRYTTWPIFHICKMESKTFWAESFTGKIFKVPSVLIVFETVRPSGGGVYCIKNRRCLVLKIFSTREFSLILIPKIKYFWYYDERAR